MQRHCTRPTNIRFRSLGNGAILDTQNLVPEAEGKYQAPYLVLHRAEFLRCMVDEARRLGVSIHLGLAVTSINIHEPALQLTNGTIFKADAILGADGLRSDCRQVVLGSPNPPIATGHMAYRATLPVSVVEQHEQLASLLAEKDISIWMGSGCHAVSYQLSEEGLFNLVFICSDDLPVGMSAMNVEKTEVMARLRDADPRLAKLFSLVPNVLKWKIETNGTALKWVDGAVALLGDACHATLPCLYDFLNLSHIHGEYWLMITEGKAPLRLSRMAPYWDSSSARCEIESKSMRFCGYMS